MILQAAGSMMLLVLSAEAFAPTTSHRCAVKTTSTQRFVTPDLLPDAPSVDALLNAMESTSRLVAEATAAAVAEESSGGWWSSYLSVFKNFLGFVHSTVDGPLKSVGIEQTWGVSIALFTIRK
jgi:hypothetical protein